MLLVGSSDTVNACYWLVLGMQWMHVTVWFYECSECMLLVGSMNAVNACYWLVLGMQWMHVTGWF